MEEKNKIDRRNFLKTVGAAGVGSVIASKQIKAAAVEPNKADPNASGQEQKTKLPQVPKRKFGKTGVEVSVLSFGAMFDIVENQIILKKCIEWGITYWDTAYSYSNGNSELGIGNFLAKNPQERKKLFIVSKASGVKKKPTPQAVVEAVEERLQTSLKRMNTKYIDLYYGIHALSDPAQLTDELKKWAESAKKRKLIRFFGFSTHKNMAECLQAAARLDWIDAIMPKYSFRNMLDENMKAAVQACHEKGIALVAMKTQGKKTKGEPTEEDKKLIKHFTRKGFTEAQAKIKAVLDDNKFCSACVKMETFAVLTENATAVLDKTKLTAADIKALEEYAKATCSGYCAGCSDICESALPDMPYVSDIMRYLMYYNSYGEQESARELFAQIPAGVRAKLLSINYKPAEKRCPQCMPIAKLIAEAVIKLA
jgi:aryl-alcohol dehydrogenase-like predicted oxidoreductase